MSLGRNKKLPTAEQLEAGYYAANASQHEANSKTVSMILSGVIFTIFSAGRNIGSFAHSLLGRLLLPAIAINEIVGVYTKYVEYQQKKRAQAGDSTWADFSSFFMQGVVATGTALAVVLALVTEGAALLASPAILVGVFGAKALTELYFGLAEVTQAYFLPDSGSLVTPARKAELYRSGNERLMSFVLDSLLAATIGVVAFAGLPAFTFVGLGASAVGAILRYSYKEGDADKKVLNINDDTSQLVTAKASGSTTWMQWALGYKHGLNFEHNLVSSHSYNHVLQDVTAQPLRSSSSSQIYTAPQPDLVPAPATRDFEIAAVSHHEPIRPRM